MTRKRKFSDEKILRFFRSKKFLKFFFVFFLALFRSENNFFCPSFCHVKNVSYLCKNKTGLER
nr:MAG TPA_asm: hypothetical protein [Caudoviricetes sp.]